MHSCDFRPHFDGDLINLFTGIVPKLTRPETELQFKEVALEIAVWVLEHRKRFSPGDRFQIIVGWPLDVRSSGRQVVKTGGTFDEVKRLVEEPSLIALRDGWDTTIFDTESN